ncbi:hypothetical protein ILUMI_06824 [Ignelater luminosus]|uniref:Uncharacterized protein n=1 Tax=Ignelater luminosus TaxID=2038154 RepID=A0A8K0D8J0_IGNLU|nr:hypothetical protein ILUMI_06824 [Ignelater luminosus]
MDSGSKKRKDHTIASHSKSSVKSKSSQRSQASVKLSIPNLFKTFGGVKDPVKEHMLEEELQKILEEMALAELNKVKKKKEKAVKPEMEVRVELAKPPEPVFPRPPYIVPDTEKQKQAKLDRRLKAEKDRNFCKWDDLQLPRPVDAAAVGRVVNVPSPDVSTSKLKIFPRKPSLSPSQTIPDVPSEAELEVKKPKSGIFINVTEPSEPGDDVDSFDLVYQRKPRPKLVRLRYFGGAIGKPSGDGKDDDKGSKASGEKQSMIEKLIAEAQRLSGEGEGEDLGPDAYLTKMFRRKVSQASKATSLNSKELVEFPVYDEEDLESEPCMTRIIQKFRRDSEAERYKPPPRKVKHGTLESHSFTKLLQTTLKEFYFGLVMGTINEADEHFPGSTRGVQGICMPVAAYCYSMILHPNKWTEFVVDDILEVGTKLYTDSIGNLHMHEEKKELEFNELHKYCYINDKKIRFQIYEPEIVGLVRSGDRKVYNLSKGLQLFYQRHRAGILKTLGTNIIIWKERHFYFFDAKGRGKDLVPDEKTGKALLANFYDVPDLATVLLEYANLGNWPFTISKLSVFKIIDKDEPEEESSKTQLRERSDYNILNENKAVIQGSFDLADLCFDFSRSKQGIAMAAVCLVYSRITPPSAWHGKTVDKIMIIGNQLYLELVESENVIEMELEQLPAVFTIGPYVVEIQVYSNVYADIMFRKNACMLQKNLEKFFETNTMAIVYIGNFIIAIWKQRNMYYCFDPYSRNNEGLKCRNGTACISMNSNIETVMQTVTTNFDNKDDIFYVHALKVLKIHRDPAQDQLFPKTMTMDDFHPETFKEYKMQKSKKKAIEKPVTADFTETAVKKLLPWDFLGPSIIEVGSGVDSLTPEQLPAMCHKFPSRAMIKSLLPPVARPIDLDSPSLSDTQIDPERPAPVQGEEAINLEAWELTQEELEMQGGAEEAGEGAQGEDELETYMAMNQYSQVHADSLESYHRKVSAQVNTDITVGFLPVPRDVLPPTSMRWKQKMKKQQELARKREMLIAQGVLIEPEVTQSMELAKTNNFINLPDNTQLLRGRANISEFGKEVDYMAPFVCMMAVAVAQKYSLATWSTDIVDYVLRSGVKLYELSRVRYDQVPILEVPKVSLGRSDYNILVEYLYDTVMKQRILEIALEKVLFKKYAGGLVVTPSYACAVFFRNQLYYLYDPFGCNEVGLGEGPSNQGVACIARFKNIHDLATRIVYNKMKRDSAEEYEFTRFVISGCTAKLIPPEATKVEKKPKKGKNISEMPMDAGEGESDVSVKNKPEETKEPEPENKVGYQLYDGILVLHGSTALQGRYDIDYNELKEDHFVCICACLMVLNYPILKWDTKRVNYVIEQGKNIHAHAEFLEISQKRIIRNILIYKHFFDIIVTNVKIPNWKQNKNLDVGLDTVMRKRNYIIVQFPNQAYVIYKHNDWYHVFDPYACLPNGKEDTSESGHACWTLFQGFNQAKERIKSQIVQKAEHYIFYTFEVSSVRKAPKKTVLSQRLLEYDLDKPVKDEQPGKPFHEKDIWLKKDPVPWSRIKANTASGKVRGKRENMWHDWDIEYSKDLFSLLGTKHQTSVEFDEKSRGKQTLCNLVVAIGMMEVYDLSEWNASIMDSILTNGDAYFKDCINEIKDDDHEFTFDDLKTTCTIYPYEFEVILTPVVEGTIFLMRSKQFNLYKALRVFCDNYACRYGICCVTKGDEIQKRFVAFGKVQENEYFMYDCQCLGSPMFFDRHGVSYIMRCKTIKRLLHVMVMTLRGGDFYIFEVDVDNFRSLI